MSNLAQHTVAVTDAMFGKKAQPVNLNAAETLELAKKLEKAIDYHMHLHHDVFGNLGESMELVAKIIEHLEAHKKEVESDE